MKPDFIKQYLKLIIRSYHNIDYKIAHTLSIRASNRRSLFHFHPSLFFKSKDSLAELTRKAKRYDIKDFFCYMKSNNRSTNIRYRLALGLYNIIKTLTTLPFRLAYKILKKLIKYEK